jgi:long-subunit fatty acid transport protein
MKSFKLLTLGLFTLISAQTFAAGLDLTLLYGTRYVYMGGQQIPMVDDAYSPFYNPAGLMGIEKATFVGHTSNLLSQYKAPVGGVQQKSGLDWGPLFFLGGGYRVNDRVSVGMAVYPTALQGGKFSGITYGPGITGKEWSLKLVRIEIAPAIAFKVVDHVNIGFSWRLGYTQMNKNVGYFSTAPFAITPAFADIKTTAWDAKGFKVGLLVDDFHGFNFATTWRWKLDHKLSGTAAIDFGTGPTTFSAIQNISIPAQMQTGLSYEWLKDRFVTSFTYEYTLTDTVQLDDTQITGFPVSVTQQPLRWRPGHTFHAGGEYTFHMSKGRKIRMGAGYAFDKSVTRSTNPSPVIAPPNSYHGIAAGGQYLFEGHTFGASMNYGKYSKVVTTLDPTLIPQTTFTGTYGVEVFLISADYAYKF